MEIKYEITPYIIEVVRKMKNGWTLKYDTSDRLFQSTYLVYDKTTESISNWTLTVLWDNGFLKCDKKYPISSYELSVRGKKYFKKLLAEPPLWKVKLSIALKRLVMRLLLADYGKGDLPLPKDYIEMKNIKIKKCNSA